MLHFATTESQFQISIDRQSIQKEVLLRFLELLQMELLAAKVAFDESVEAIGEEIMSDWWTKNKANYLQLEG